MPLVTDGRDFELAHAYGTIGQSEYREKKKGTQAFLVWCEGVRCTSTSNRSMSHDGRCLLFVKGQNPRSWLQPIGAQGTEGHKEDRGRLQLPHSQEGANFPSDPESEVGGQLGHIFLCGFVPSAPEHSTKRQWLSRQCRGCVRGGPEPPSREQISVCR